MNKNNNNNSNFDDDKIIREKKEYSDLKNRVLAKIHEDKKRQKMQSSLSKEEKEDILSSLGNKPKYYKDFSKEEKNNNDVDMSQFYTIIDYKKREKEKQQKELEEQQKELEEQQKELEEQQKKELESTLKEDENEHNENFSDETTEEIVYKEKTSEDIERSQELERTIQESVEAELTSEKYNNSTEEQYYSESSERTIEATIENAINNDDYTTEEIQESIEEPIDDFTDITDEVINESIELEDEIPEESIEEPIDDFIDITDEVIEEPIDKTIQDSVDDISQKNKYAQDVDTIEEINHIETEEDFIEETIEITIEEHISETQEYKINSKAALESEEIFMDGEITFEENLDQNFEEEKNVSFPNEVFEQEEPELIDGLNLEDTNELDSTNDLLSETTEELLSATDDFELSDSEEISYDEITPIIDEDGIQNTAELEELKKQDFDEDTINEKNDFIKTYGQTEELEQYTLFESKEDENWCKNYKFPTLKPIKKIDNSKKLEREAKDRTERVNHLFKEEKIKAKITSYQIENTTTIFNVETDVSVTQSEILSLEKEIKLSMNVDYVRILISSIGTPTIGIEVNNTTKKSSVLLNNIINDDELSLDLETIEVPIGQDMFGKVIKVSLKDSQHLLIAGSSIYDKLLSLNTILATFITKYNPNDLKTVLIDSKATKLKPFHGIPHLVANITNRKQEIKSIFENILEEIEKRKKLLSDGNFKSISEFNFNNDDDDKLPFIVLMIAELKEIVGGKDNEIEKLLLDITKDSHKFGIYSVISTRNPEAEIISKFKENTDSKIAFRLPTEVCSKEVLDYPGAEKLSGLGDLLVSQNKSIPLRGQCASISTEDLNKIVTNAKKQCTPYYNFDYKGN